MSGTAMQELGASELVSVKLQHAVAQ